LPVAIDPMPTAVLACYRALVERAVHVAGRDCALPTAMFELPEAIALWSNAPFTLPVAIAPMPTAILLLPIASAPCW
jgi:hypothetical protein